MKHYRRPLTMGAALCVALTAAWGTQLMAQQRQGPNLDEMFITEDNDGFDPGLAIGEQFPAIRALYDGEEISSIDGFMGDSGAIFIAVRSADW